MSPHSRWLVAALALVVAAGCTDGTGSEMGRAEALIRDNPNATTAAVSSAQVLAHVSGGAAAGAPAAFSGSIAGDAQISISADGNQWYDLGSPNGITIQLQSTNDSTTAHGEVDAPAGQYNRIRVILDGAEARLNVGSTFGGLVLQTQLNVVLGGSDQRVVIDQTVPSFEVKGKVGAVTVIRLELNAEAWLTESSVQALMVQDTALQTALSVAVETQES
ncbi:MAG TPA: DUF4382 domain-containing protein [Gemmatimonadales bacterium]|nr:DUF4382 domain-containing protein [Gemmatimonadales bacterium]